MVRSIKKSVSIFLAVLIFMTSSLCAFAYDIDDIVTAAGVYIFRMEGNYDSINANDNGAVSIGKVQWHGPRALQLLKIIVEANPGQAKDILGETLYNEVVESDLADWNYRWFNSEEVKVFKKLLATDESKKAQDELAFNDIKAYITRAQSMGITDGRALVYFADLENQLGSYGVTRVAKIAIGIAGLADKVTLDILYQAAMQDSVAASSPGRRRTTYEYCLSLNFGDVEVPSDFVVGEYKITAEPSLRVRKGPSTFYDTVGSNLPEGAFVEVVEISGDWGKIVRNGVEGWINLLYAEYVGSSSNEQPDIVRYDVNGNGKTDAGDARLTLRASAGIDTLTEAQQKAADADSSGRITAADARLILRASAKMD